MDSDALISPCIGVCRMDEHDHYCQGCLRSRDEIGAWPWLDAEARLALKQTLADRRAGLESARTRTEESTAWSD